MFLLFLLNLYCSRQTDNFQLVDCGKYLLSILIKFIDSGMKFILSNNFSAWTLQVWVISYFAKFTSVTMKTTLDTQAYLLLLYSFIEVEKILQKALQFECCRHFSANFNWWIQNFWVCGCSRSLHFSAKLRRCWRIIEINYIDNVGIKAYCFRMSFCPPVV